MGSEVYNLKRRRDTLINEAIGEDTLNLSYYRFNDNYNLIDVVDDCSMIPLMADKKVVIVENPAFLVGGKNLENDKTISTFIEYLKNSNIQTTLIIYCDQPVDSKKKIYKELESLLKFEKFDLLNQEDFRRYIIKDLNDAGIKLDNNALNELIIRLPISIENWKRELEKLKLYPNKIDKTVVDSLVCRPLENNAFDLVDAVLSHNLDKALSIYHDLLVTNKNDIMSLIGLLGSQIRFMCQCKTLNEQHVSVRDIAQRFNCKDQRVSITLSNCGLNTSEEILNILSELSDLDQKIKKGLVDQIAGLELFIIKATKR